MATTYKEKIMKRFQIHLLLALSLIFLGTLPCMADSKAESWSYPSSNPGRECFTGSGTASSPYLIQCAQDLANLAYIVTDNNDDVTGKYFKMTSDIYLNDFTVDANGDINANGDLKKWTPIGEYGSIWNDDFQGIFDGDGHTIYGLYIEENDNRRYVGLFGTIEDATIKNLTIRNAYVNIKEPSTDGMECGTLVGTCINSTFSNVNVVDCYVLGSNSNKYSIHAGGLIGKAYNDITLNDCSFDGTIHTTIYGRDAYLGGLIAAYSESGLHSYITLRLTRCQSKGEIKVIDNGSSLITIGGFLAEEFSDDYKVYLTECVNSTNLIIDRESDATQTPISIVAHHFTDGATEMRKCVNLGDITIADSKLEKAELTLSRTVDKYYDCANYGHYILATTDEGIQATISPGQNQVYHTSDGQNLILWQEAKPTKLGTNDTYNSNGTELSLDSLNNNTALVAKLNEEAGENIWGFYDITENGKTYSVPFPVACGGVPTSMYKNDKGQYVISSEADLRMLQNIISNATTTNGYYILTQDLDMSASAPLTQMGDETHAFSGTLDGNGHVISGLTIKGHALIGNLSGTVKNLGLVNMKFTGGNDYCAPFAYKAGLSADASILNCYAGGNITLADSTNTSTILAGLIYEASANKVSIKNCYFRGILANATSVSNQGHFYYGMVGSNNIGTSLSLNDSYAHFSFNETLGIGAGILPTNEASAPSGTNYHYLCPQFSDSIGKVNSNAELAACFAVKEGWLTGAYRPVLDSVRHYELTTYNEQTVYTDAIPLDDDSCRNEIFCHELTSETANDQLLWALPKVAICDAENNVNYLLSCQLYADKPFRFSPPEGSKTSGQLHYPLTFSDEYAIRLMCLPAPLYKRDLPEGAQLFLVSKPIGDATEGYEAYLDSCDSVPAGMPFIIYMSQKPTKTVDMVLSGDIVATPQSTGTLNGQELESGLTGTFEDKHLDNGCANINVQDINIEIKNEDSIDIKPFGAYIDADATVSCTAGVLLKETSNYINQTLATYEGRTVTVFLSRNLQTSGWNTLCLPFDVSEDELTKNYGSDTRLEELNSVTTAEDGTCTLCFTRATDIEAGKCYLIQPGAVSLSAFQFDNKTLITEPITTLTSTDGYTISFIGTFARTTIDGNDTSKGTYFTQNNKIYKVAQGRTITMNGFRCWIETSKPDALTKANIVHADGTTSIARIVPIGTTEDNHRIYDLQGIETQHPLPHHIYIMDGQPTLGR